ncbi:MAG: YafY family transcriptional regulator [Lachnospiraceae bacterium]|nr:YafY family transcriptional regulator [Lachnospiraceae bacterium]
MINRLLSIIYILMNKGTVTATELAERFEVSVRTIYRDIDTLGMAGIPVYTTKGRGGGISLTEQFVLNKMLVSKKEQKQILAALISLRETGVYEEEEILEKLGDFFMEKPESWVAIDFSDWSGRRQELFGQIKDAILNRRVLQFDYYGQHGEMTHRCVEPVQLLFKEYTWYMRAFCRTRQAIRLFKVLRMKRVEALDETFDIRDDLTVEPPSENMGAPNLSVVIEDPEPEIILWIDKREAYRIYDRFDEDEITVLPDGHFEVHYRCTLDDWVYGLILSFGPSAIVLEPKSVRTEIQKRIAEMGRLYE